MIKIVNRIKLILIILFLIVGRSLGQVNIVNPVYNKYMLSHNNMHWIPYNRSENNSTQFVDTMPNTLQNYKRYLNKFFNEKNQSKSISKSINNTDLSVWQKLDGPYGGDVRRFYNFNDTLYTITDREIYKYVNNSWCSLNFEKVWAWQIYCMYKYDSGRIIVGCDDGIYYTDDEGLSWNLIQDDLMGSGVFDILKMNNNDMFLSTSKGIYISQNNDINFRLLSLDNLHVQTVCFDSSGDIWAGTDQDVYKAKYYSSNPNNYSIKNSKNNFRNAYSNLTWQRMYFPADYYKKIIFDSKGVVYILSFLNNRVYRSSDSGKTWDYLQGPYVGDINIYNDQLFITGMYNLFLFNSSSLQWESSRSDIFLLTTFFADSSNMYIGTLGAGALKFNLQENKFTGFSNGINASTIRTITPMKNGELLISTDADSFYVSSDKGLTWNSICKGWSLHVKNQKDGTVYAAAGSGLIKSQNYGAAWDTLNIDVYPYFISAFDVTDDNKTICAGTSTGEVYVSNDGGKNFDKIRNSNYIFVDAVKILNDKTFLIYNDSLYYTNDAGKTFVTIKNNSIYGITDIIRDNAGYTYISSFGGLFRSLDGINWTKLNIPKPGSYYLRLDKFDNLYSVTPDGVVQVSSDQGMDWVNLSDNVFNSFGWSLSLDDDGYFYLGTQAMGLYRTSIELKKKNISSFSLSNNFPNPFNASTTIQYDVPLPSFITLKIYDIMGREIQTLISKYMASGSYYISWNAAKFASGVYFYQLRAGDFIETKKLILLK